MPQERAEGPAADCRCHHGRASAKRKVARCFLSKFRFKPLNPDTTSTSREDSDHQEVGTESHTVPGHSWGHRQLRSVPESGSLVPSSPWRQGCRDACFRVGSPLQDVCMQTSLFAKPRHLFPLLPQNSLPEQFHSLAASPTSCPVN